MSLTLGVHHPSPAWDEAELHASIAASGEAISAQVVPLDITDAGAVTALLQEAQPHQIYHLAARASGASTDRDAVFLANVEGSRHLLDVAKSLSSSPKVLLISSGYVYGSVRPGYQATETDPVAASGSFGPYTDSKIAMEEVASEFDNCVTMRAFAHTGPGQEESYAIPAFAAQIARIEAGLMPPVLRVGNLEAERDICDVRDVVRAYRLAMDRAPVGHVYNVCSGTAAAMSDILRHLVAASMVAVRVEQDPARMRASDIARSAGDPHRIASELGWSPRIPLEVTLSDTLDYWRARIQ
jgi:GDP-4-dehydro-6-deoxy-D-mannose reductase